jgi:hypothetical protein
VITRTSHYGMGQSTYKGLTKRSTRIPIGRPESADVLKASFAACGTVTWAKVLEAGRQIPRLEQGMAEDPRRNQA